mmetsp:Transcript_8424/g.19515  ORF Transcript_8424/g.19515 Transcript_8424/m.19515 type:complete len:116 (+) Transcript_8424:285-632(+)|eukprot:CAMPEP_0116822184 /NCGR_PEP_ID=MMETSP0418-20121206/128_1 /TAXON_ID=1158023 /ORGANISM="Astrosyne radiata, Strain 13vi08-1A" /LENGTH=115 /DNA_ID=CAMNT_0004450271 /DNA_START=271 /DNA_END=621 /DNA_ORIENTATION=+
MARLFSVLSLGFVLFVVVVVAAEERLTSKFRLRSGGSSSPAKTQVPADLVSDRRFTHRLDHHHSQAKVPTLDVINIVSTHELRETVRQRMKARAAGHARMWDHLRNAPRAFREEL